MLINADFSRAVVITPDAYHWVPSPQAGVERMMLDRIGDEKARATSIVRYAAGSSFPRHAHPAGEEILVLSGTFSDEGGDYPAGWYLRSPPGSSHQPFSHPGAIIFVKLRQMPPDDDHTVRTDTRSWQQARGRAVLALFSAPGERVTLQRLEPGDALFDARVDSAELLVLAGELHFAGRACPQGSWVRLPVGEYPSLVAGDQGATLYMKTGQLVAPLGTTIQHADP